MKRISDGLHVHMKEDALLTIKSHESSLHSKSCCTQASCSGEEADGQAEFRAAVSMFDAQVPKRKGSARRAEAKPPLTQVRNTLKDSTLFPNELTS